MVKTYDIVNAGPKNRFMANGKIVSNCGSGAQLQNLPRNKVHGNILKVLENVLEKEMTVQEIRAAYGAPMVVISELIRPMFIARKGYWIARGDYSQIESRVLAYLAGATEKLDAFRAKDAGTGPDLYTTTAAKMFGVHYSEIGDERRQTGKLAELSLGYAGGSKAFLAFAKLYRIPVTEEQAEEYKIKWREANPLIVRLWHAMEKAAVRCLENDIGIINPIAEDYDNHIVPGMYFKRNKEVMVLRLISGRHLFFWYPRLEVVETPYGPKRAVTYATENKITRQWSREAVYGGLLAAMVTQGTSTRDIMGVALDNMEKRNLRPILTVHDEGICEVPKDLYSEKEAAKAVIETMLDMPEWAAGIPLAVEASANDRYAKAK